MNEATVIDITRALEIARAERAAGTPNEVIQQIAAALRIAAMGGRELWGYDEITAYCKFKRNYVVNTITARADFPRACKVGGVGQPRWVAAEVMAWWESQR
jgi:predicted DNA-binding transcriptional regulator AlpA